MRLLGIDPGSYLTGLAVWSSDTGFVRMGTMVPDKMDIDGKILNLRLFEERIRDYIRHYDITHVACEYVQSLHIFKSVTDARPHLNMVSMVENACVRERTPRFFYTPDEWKEAIGAPKRRKSKREAQPYVQTVNEKFGFRFDASQHDIAAAVGILYKLRLMLEAQSQ